MFFSPQYWRNKQEELFMQGRYPEAVDALDQLTILEPCDNIAWSGKGYLLRKLSRHVESHQSYKIADELKEFKLQKQIKKKIFVKPKPGDVQFYYGYGKNAKGTEKLGEIELDEKELPPKIVKAIEKFWVDHPIIKEKSLSAKFLESIKKEKNE